MIKLKPNLVKMPTFLKICVGAPFLKLDPDATILMVLA